VITDIGTTSRKFRVQFQAPPQVASYLFQLHVKSDSYYGTDATQEVVLNVQDASKLEEKIVEEVIPEFSEDGICSSMDEC
jgi:translocation protein SEC63